MPTTTLSIMDQTPLEVWIIGWNGLVWVSPCRCTSVRVAVPSLRTRTLHNVDYGAMGEKASTLNLRLRLVRGRSRPTQWRRIAGARRLRHSRCGLVTPGDPLLCLRALSPTRRRRRAGVRSRPRRREVRPATGRDARRVAWPQSGVVDGCVGSIRGADRLGPVFRTLPHTTCIAWSGYVASQ
jgi:hypothetical protein